MDDRVTEDPAERPAVRIGDLPLAILHVSERESVQNPCPDAALVCTGPGTLGLEAEERREHRVGVSLVLEYGAHDEFSPGVPEPVVV